MFRKQAKRYHHHQGYEITVLERRVLLSGDLDPTFGFGGLAQGPVGATQPGYGQSVATVQSDGKLLVFAQGTQLTAFRFLSNGALDPSFGSDGSTMVASGSYSKFILQTADGNIFAGSTSTVYELTSSGALVSSFGSNGSLAVPATDTIVTASADGNDLIVGVDGADAANNTCQIMRLEPNGVLDASFGTAGVITLPGNVGNILVTSEGKIVAEAGSPSAIYRFNSDGSVDTSFGQGGEVSTPNISGLAPEFGPNGQLYISTFVSVLGTFSYQDTATIYRLTASGLPDATFTTISSTSLTYFNSTTFAVETDGSVLAGSAANPALIVSHYTSTGAADGTSDQINIDDASPTILPLATGKYIAIGKELNAIQMTATNVADTSFGTGGVLTALDVFAPPSSYSAVATQSDRSIIVGGLTSSPQGQEFYVARDNVDGSADSSFGTQGITAVSCGSLQADSLVLMVEPDDKIIVAGNLYNPAIYNATASAMAVTRLNSDGTVDTSFGNDGTLIIQGDTNPKLLWQNSQLLVGSENTIRRFNDNGTFDSSFTTTIPGGSVFAVQADGKIIEGLNPSSSSSNAEIRRFNTNGSVDTTFGSNGIAQSVNTSGLLNVVIETNGTIVAFVTYNTDYTSAYVLKGFNSNGSIDTTFGSGGEVTTAQASYDGEVLANGQMLQQPNGQLLVTTTVDASSALVQRYSANGLLDNTFGNGGSTQVGSDISKYAGKSVSVQSIAALDNAGRLLLTGGAENIDGGSLNADIVALQTTNAAAPGPATQTLIYTQPTNIFSSQEGVSVTLALKDANGALAIGDTSSFTIAIGGGTPGVMLQGAAFVSTVVTAQGGFVYFGPFQIYTPGTGYTLTVSSTETPSITTASFNVIAPEVFAQQPSGNVQVGMLAPVVVDFYNLEGEIDTTNNSTVFLSIDNNPENATLAGTTQVAAVNGVATFDDLSIATPGTGYILDTGEATSTPFNVVDQHLAFATQPDRVTTAGTLGAVTVDVLDADGNLVTTDDSNVTLALAGGSTSATLGGTTTVASINGVATFSNLSITTIGNAYTLTASDGGDSPATTTAFNTVPAIVPSNLTPTPGSVRLPSQVVSGTKFTARIPLSITNNANAFKGFVTINVFADADSILDGEQVSVTTLKKKIALKAGKRAYLALTVKSLPLTLSPGTYHLLTQIIDPTGATSLGATSQTITVVAPVIQPVVTAGPVSPLDLSGKRVGAVWITIANEGNVAARGVKIILSPSLDGAAPVVGVVLDSIEINTTIAAGGHRKFKLRFKPSTSLAAGSYYPYATVSLDGISATAVGTTSFTVG